MNLRDYQIKFISDVSGAHRAGHQGVVGQMPTGAGKTVCMARIAKALSDRNGRVLIVVHRDELVRQTCSKLKQFGLQFGTIAAGLGKNKNPNARVQVAMVQTISRKIDVGLLVEYNYIIFDEAHLAAARSYKKIMLRWPNARRLGLSATPWRLDGQGLGDVGSTIVRGPSINDLIVHGSLVPFVTYSIPAIDFSNIKKVRGEYDIEAQSIQFKKAGVVGDVVDHYLRLCKGRSCIVFSSSIEHSMRMRDKFLEKGITAEHIDGGTPTAEREVTLERLASGETTVVCNYGCLTEGFDCSIVSAIVIARKTASSALFRQMCGRGLRTHDGKQNCIILDHGGNALDHGNLDYDFQFSLDGKEKASSVKLCKACPICAAICENSASVCHVCEHDFSVSMKEREVKESAGELVAIPSGLAPIRIKNPERLNSDKIGKWLSSRGWA